MSDDKRNQPDPIRAWRSLVEASMEFWSKSMAQVLQSEPPTEAMRTARMTSEQQTPDVLSGGEAAGSTREVTPDQPAASLPAYIAELDRRISQMQQSIETHTAKLATLVDGHGTRGAQLEAIQANLDQILQALHKQSEQIAALTSQHQQIQTRLDALEQQRPTSISPQTGSPQTGSPQIGSPQIGSPQIGSPQTSYTTLEAQIQALDDQAANLLRQLRQRPPALDADTAS